MMKQDLTFKAIIQGTNECIFSVGRELVELGFDKNIVLNHIIF